MKFIFGLLLLSSVSALAQQPEPPPDPAFMQKSIAAIQAQRNAAMDAQAWLSAKVQALTEENAAINARIKALQDKYEPKKEAPK